MIRGTSAVALEMQRSAIYSDVEIRVFTHELLGSRKMNMRFDI